MELADAVRDRYLAAGNKDKRRVLEEFIAATGYFEKSAIRVLNSLPELKGRQTCQRPSIYDEAARGALIVLWEASDRICGKRLKALLPILLPALERNGHLKLDEEIRHKILSMSASTIDRLLRIPRTDIRSANFPHCNGGCEHGDCKPFNGSSVRSVTRNHLPLHIPQAG